MTFPYRSAVLVLALLSLAPGLRAQGAAAAPQPAPPAQEVYRIGSGDVLLVTIHPGGTGEVVESELTVSGDGTIDVVHAGRMKVGGLSASDVREQIRRKLIGSGVYLQPQVSVNVQEYLSQGVNVAGAVTTQGRYFLKGPTHLLDIVSMSAENMSRRAIFSGSAAPSRAMMM